MPDDFDFGLLEGALPPIIWRARWNDLADKHGLPFRKGYLQNLDYLGRGPKRFYRRGRVGYRREDVIAWLNQFMSENASSRMIGFGGRGDD